MSRSGDLRCTCAPRRVHPLHLTGVAKGSEEELLRDYVDFLRQRGLRQWAPESSEAMAVRRRYKGDLSGHDDPSDTSDTIGDLIATQVCRNYWNVRPTVV